MILVTTLLQRINGSFYQFDEAIYRDLPECFFHIAAKSQIAWIVEYYFQTKFIDLA